MCTKIPNLRAFHTEITERFIEKVLPRVSTEDTEKIAGSLRALCESISVPSV